MNHLRFISIMAFVLIGLSCEGPENQSNESIMKRIQDLQNQVEDLELQLRQQQLKTRVTFMRIGSHLSFNSPFDQFLIDSDDFWNNPVDVGAVECSKRCIKANQERRKICDDMPQGQAKSDCYADALDSVVKCQNSCPKQPLPTP